MAIWGPGVLTAGPPRRQYAYGLFSVADFTTPAPENWQAGSVWQQLSCTGAVLTGLGNCDNSTYTYVNPLDPTQTAAVTPSHWGIPKLPWLNQSQPIAQSEAPFVVAAGYQCTTGVAPQQAQHFADEALRLQAEYAAEQWLYARVVAAQAGGLTFELGPLTTQNAPTPWTLSGLTITETEYRNAIAALEWFIADNYGMLSVIHMQRGLAQLGLSFRALEAHGGRLFTKLGTPVVAGGGYSNRETTPNPFAMFTTSQVGGWRSEPRRETRRRLDLLDTATNKQYAIAEQFYLLQTEWGCKQATIQWGA